MSESLTKTAQAAYGEMKELLGSLDGEEAMQHYAVYKAESDELAGKMAALKDYMLERVIESGEEKLAFALGSVSLQQGRETVTVSAKKLVDQGVALDVIEAATERRRGEDFVVIRVKQEKGEK